MSQLLLVTYFFYGLAFLVMGIAMLLEREHFPSLAEGRSTSCLAAFGLLHGTHEWLESYLLQAQAAGTALPDWLAPVRLALLLLSFVALFLYAYFALRVASPRYQGRRLVHFGRLLTYELAVIALVALTYRGQPPAWIDLLDGLGRYLLAVPAAGLAALALYTQARVLKREQRQPLVLPVRVAAGGFALYALAQLFVRPIPAFPAQYLNQAVFLAAFGFPIQLIRAAAAIVVTTGLLRTAQGLAQERQAMLEAAHQAQLRASEERDALRRELLQHTVQSQEDERARIARELHDEVAQYLSAFSLELGALKNVLKRADTNRMVDHLQELNRQMSQSLYGLVRDLRPAQLDDLGLVPAIKSLIDQDFQPKGLKVELKLTGRPERLNNLVETVLYRVSQEALNNVRRHAGVEQATIELEYACDRLLMRITDAGRGFDPAENFRPPRGWGLAGMRERVESLQGRLCIESQPGHGTLIEVSIPLAETAGKEDGYGQDQIAAGG